MTHLVADKNIRNHGTACGELGIGDRRTIYFQDCTCSLCEINAKYFDAHMLTLAVPAYRDKAAIGEARRRRLVS